MQIVFPVASSNEGLEPFLQEDPQPLLQEAGSSSQFFSHHSIEFCAYEECSPRLSLVPFPLTTLSP